jgi:hypothetical protein
MVSLDDFHRRLLASEFPGLANSMILVRSLVPIPMDIPGPWVFVPDLHLLSSMQGRGYSDADGEFFHLGANAKAVLMAFLEQLLELKGLEPGDYGGLKVVQLGDFHDLWREARHWWGEDVRRIMRRQYADHGDLCALFGDLEAVRVIGNHESALEDDDIAAENSDIWPVERLFDALVQDLEPSGAFRMLVLHGHQVDPGEKGIRKRINPIGARQVTHPSISKAHRDEWHYEVAPDACDRPLNGPVQQAVVHYREDAETKAQRENQLYYGDIPSYAVTDPDLLARHAGAAQLAFIGHTHHPRIVMDGPADYRLVDSGSWVNRAVPAGSKNDEVHFDNAQIGVLARNEVGIIQIG